MCIAQMLNRVFHILNCESGKGHLRFATYKTTKQGTLAQLRNCPVTNKLSACFSLKQRTSLFFNGFPCIGKIRKKLLIDLPKQFPTIDLFVALLALPLKKHATSLLQKHRMP